MIGLNFIYFEGMFGAHMEMLSLLTFICAYAWHMRIIGKEKVSWSELLGYAMVLSVMFLSKYSTIPFVGAFILHFQLRKQYARFLQVALVVATLAGSWFILRDILLVDKVISAIAHTPFKREAASASSTLLINKYLFKIIGVGRRFIQILFDINGLAFLLPFTLLYFVGEKNSCIKQANWLLLIMSAAFFSIFGYVDIRYVYPIFIVLIPPSLEAFNELLAKHTARVARAVYITIFVILAGYQHTMWFTSPMRSENKLLTGKRSSWRRMICWPNKGFLRMIAC